MIELVQFFDDVLSVEDCNTLVSYIQTNKEKNKPNYGPYIRPWHDNDTIPRKDITDQIILKIIDEYKNRITRRLTETYMQTLYPSFTDLVLWREGREMSLHKDNGYGNDGLSHRHISLVTYLNDDFLGGETVIFNNNHEIISLPKTGSAVSFVSDDRCMHLVKKITSGTRVTLPIWFTTDINYKEN